MNNYPHVAVQVTVPPSQVHLQVREALAAIDIKAEYQRACERLVEALVREQIEMLALQNITVEDITRAVAERLK